MLITNHVLSGAVVGLLLRRRPAAAAAVGVASHFALDLIPHFGVDMRRLMHVAVPDGLLGLAAIGVLGATTPPAHRAGVLAGVTGACLPDLDKPGQQFFGRSPYPARFDAFHAGIQNESPRRLPVEFVAATLFAGTVAALLRRLE